MSENFSISIKSELCKGLTDLDRKYACLYGILLFSHRFAYGEDTTLRTESKTLSQTIPHLISSVFGNTIEYTYTQNVLKDGDYSYKYIFDKDSADTMIRQYNINPIREVDLTKIDNNSISSFLAGAFLSCGSITNPNVEYHLEFSVAQELLANDLLAILKQYSLPFKVSVRGRYYVVYVKGSEQIEDTLTFMGAESSTLEIMNVKIFKDVQNRLNRRSNCEKANYIRCYSAGKKQYEDIEYIENTIGIDSLPDTLKETAYIRLENPEMPLRELIEQFNEPISRSGLSRRLQKLSNICSQIKDGTYCK